MGELGRERQARSIHVSRGHLTAGAVAVVLWTVCCVSLGYLWGRQGAAPAGVAAVADPPERLNRELIDAISRLEGAEALGELDAGYRSEHQLTPPTQRREAVGDPLQGDPAPVGSHTLSLGQYDVAVARELRDELARHDIHVWRAPVVTGDQITVRLAIGGFDGPDAAATEGARVAPVLGSLGVDRVEVVPIR